MTPCHDWFCTYELVSEGFVFMGDDHALEITGVGTIKIKMFNASIRTIQRVRHVKGLKKNLLSIGQLDNLKCKTYIESGILKVVKCALVVMKAKKMIANLYMLLRDTLQEAEASIASKRPRRNNNDVASQIRPHVGMWFEDFCRT